MLQGEHSAILSTFIIPPFVIKIFVLSTFEFYTGFTVHVNEQKSMYIVNYNLVFFTLFDIRNNLYGMKNKEF